MSAVQSARFMFHRSNAQASEPKVVLDRDLERQLYVEVVSALRGSEFDETVCDAYSYRPERELPQAKDSRRQQKKYLFSL
jgi:hypothetical protein